MYVKDVSGGYSAECAYGTPIQLSTLLSKPKTEDLLGRNILMIWGHWNVSHI